VVGGGFAGLWSAVLAKLQQPDRDVVLLEGARIGWAASGRNGGFVSTSLTHGLTNGRRHVPDELPRLVDLGRRNFAAMRETVLRHGIDCGLEETGTLSVASQPWHVAELEDTAHELRHHGYRVDVLDDAQVRELVDSPTYRGGLLTHDDGGLVNPARLAWGLGQLAQELGVRLHERSPVRSVSDQGFFVTVRTPDGEVCAQRAVLATNGFRPLLRRDRLRVAPVHNYALMTEPLDAEQRRAIGWQGRQGLSGMEAEFHYYRLTDDDRILWGGPHTDYMYGNAIAGRHERRPEIYRMLADTFFTTFPQLEGLRFSHAWGGVIDVCSRAFVFFDQAFGGKVVSAAGFSGLGVASTHFAARVMLDLLGDEPTELTQLQIVRRRPLPFPPEPVRSVAIAATKRSIARIDRREGRRDAWLRALDRAGVGFDG
jgi:glycine/D-amino acid oxidase-like deaminating enzyme